MGAGERKNRSYALDRYPNLKEQKLQEQKELNAMLGANLSTVTTADLVAELERRDGVGIKHVMGWVDFDQPEKYEIRIYRDHGFMESSGKYDGPACIIVVRGE